MQLKAIAVAAIWTIGGAALAQETPPPPKPAPPATPETTYKVARGIIKGSLEFDGTLEPVSSWPVRCRLEAYQGELTIAEVVAHGKQVKSGDLLLRFDAKKVEEAIRAAENDLVAARAARERAEEEWKLSERGEKMSMQATEREAKQSAERLDLFLKVDLPLAIKDLDLELKGIQDSIDDQKEELEQLKKMYKSEELTSATADIVIKRAERRLADSQTRQEMAKQRAAKVKEHDLPMQQVQLEAAKEQAAYNLELLQKTAGFTKRERESARTRGATEMARQEEGFAKLKEDLAALTVKAPADGTVYYGTFDGGRWNGTTEVLRALKVGEKAQAGQVAMTIVGPDLDASIVVVEKDLDRFVEGLEAVAVPAGFPSLRWKGTTLAAALIPANEGMFEARVKLGASAPRVVAGMKCHITVSAPVAKNVLVVPVAAVIEEEGQKRCKLKGAEKPVDVKTGLTDGEMVEILEGLKEGDEVVLPSKK